MTDVYDVLVLGAGPAGLAAAIAAARDGRRVGLIDAAARPGGQVWRHDIAHAPSLAARRAIEQVTAHPGIDWLAQTKLVCAGEAEVLVETPTSAHWLGYHALVLASGARELLLPFPGWTLPGITGAGGLQALAKQGLPLAGRRVVIGGSGPLLWAAAATARRHGALVLAIHEQAPPRDVARFAAGLWRWPGKLAQAAWLRGQLAGVPYRCHSVVTQAHGDEHVQAIEVSGPRGVERIECDQLAIGYGLLPNVEAGVLMGCALDYAGAHPYLRVDSLQRTSRSGIYAAGEACGIGGRDSALLEGAIAGHMAIGDERAAQRLLRERDHARAFAAHLHKYFALGPRLRALADADTIVCRCEDVRLGALAGYADGRSAKLATRCGMGACQGRICGGALAEWGLFPRGGYRPPLFPARLSTLGDTAPRTSADSRG